VPQLPQFACNTLQTLLALLALLALLNLITLQVLWRPRPRSLLTKDQVADVKKTLKDKYWKRFDEEDNEVKNAQVRRSPHRPIY
jgi:hypothetical protein